MAKKVNKNMVVGLTGVGFVLMTGAGLAMIFQLRDVDPAGFTSKAEQHRELEEWGKARLYYHKAYTVSEDEKYLVEEGQMYRSMGQDAKASQVWRAAVTQNPTCVPALEKLLEYYVDLAEISRTQSPWRQVKDTADALLALKEDDAQALFCLGKALLLLRQEDESYKERGLTALRRSVELSPESVDYALALASSELEEDRSESSEDLLSRLVASNMVPGRDAFLVRATYAFFLANRGFIARRSEKQAESKEALEQAVKYYEDAIKFAGDDPENQADARVRLAGHLYLAELLPAIREDGDSPKVSAVREQINELLDEAIKIEPDGFRQYSLQADVYVACSMPSEAVAACERRIDKGIDRKGLAGYGRKAQLFMLLVKASNSAVAASQGESISPEDRTEILDKAGRFAVDARNEVPGLPEAWNAEGRVQIARGKDLEALAAFEKADIIYNPPNLANKRYLAALYLMAGQIGAAREAAEFTIGHPRASANDWITYAKILNKLKKHNGATQAALNALAMGPDSREAILMVAECYRLIDRPDKMQETLSKLESDSPDDLLVRAKALANEERYDEAISLLKPLLEAEPGNLKVVRLVVSILRKNGQAGEAVAIVKRGLEAAEDKSAFLMLELAVTEGLSPEERDRRVVELLNQTEDAFLRASSLANHYTRQHEWDKAEEQLQKAETLLAQGATPEAIKRRKQGGQIPLRGIMDQRFSILCMLERFEEAEQLAEQARDRDIDGVQGSTFLGRLQIYQKTPKLAVATLESALEAQPNNSRTLTFLGQAYLDLQRTDQAKLTFERALKVNPASGFAHKGMAMLAKAEKDSSSYNRHLSACKELIPNDPWVIAEFEGINALADPAQAANEVEQKLAEDPDNLELTMKLANLLVNSNQLEKAEGAYVKAMELSPNSLVVASAVSRFYQALDRKKEAEELLQNLADNLEEPRQQAAAYVLLGQFFIQEGRLEESNTAYLTAADKHEGLGVFWAVGRHFFTTNQFSQSLKWLAKASAIADKDGSSALESIKTMHVEALVKLQEYEQALAGIEMLLTRFPAAGSNALLLRAEIELAMGQLDKAVQTLTMFLETRPDHPMALYRRARCRAAEGRWSQAISDLELLKARDPGAVDLRPRRMLAQAYSRVGRVDLAVAELESLREQHPNDTTLAEELIAVHVQEEAFDQAEQVCMLLSAKTPGDPRWIFRRANINTQRARSADEGSTERTRAVARALQDAKTSCKMSSNATGYVRNYFALCGEFEKWEQGIDLYENALTDKQRTPQTREAYANLLAATGRETDAIATYRLAAHEGKKQIGMMYVQNVGAAAERTLGAARTLELLRTPPDDKQLLLTNEILIASALAGDNQHSESISRLEQLIANSAGDDERKGLNQMLGLVAAESGDYERAKKAYEEVIRLDPRNWAALNNLAFMLCDNMGRCAEAQPYAEEAYKLSKVVSIADTLAAVLIGVGKHQEVVGLLVSAIQENPDFVPARIRLAEAFRRMGDFDKAIAQLDECQELLDKGLSPEEADHVKEMLTKVNAGDTSP